MSKWFAFIVAVIASILFIAPPSRAEQTEKTEKNRPIRALLITGGGSHDYKHQKDILSKGISARADVEWTIALEGDDRTHKHSIYTKPDWWKGYDVIVHDECF